MGLLNRFRLPSKPPEGSVAEAPPRTSSLSQTSAGGLRIPTQVRPRAESFNRFRFPRRRADVIDVDDGLAASSSGAGSGFRRRISPKKNPDEFQSSTMELHQPQSRIAQNENEMNTVDEKTQSAGKSFSADLRGFTPASANVGTISRSSTTSSALGKDPTVSAPSKPVLVTSPSSTAAVVAGSSKAAHIGRFLSSNQSFGGSGGAEPSTQSSSHSSPATPTTPVVGVIPARGVVTRRPVIRVDRRQAARPVSMASKSQSVKCLTPISDKPSKLIETDKTHKKGDIVEYRHMATFTNGERPANKAPQSAFVPNLLASKESSSCESEGLSPGPSPVKHAVRRSAQRPISVSSQPIDRPGRTAIETPVSEKLDSRSGCSQQDHPTSMVSRFKWPPERPGASNVTAPQPQQDFTVSVSSSATAAKSPSAGVEQSQVPFPATAAVTQAPDKSPSATAKPSKSVADRILAHNTKTNKAASPSAAKSAGTENTAASPSRASDPDSPRPKSPISSVGCQTPVDIPRERTKQHPGGDAGDLGVVDSVVAQIESALASNHSQPLVPSGLRPAIKQRRGQVAPQDSPNTSNPTPSKRRVLIAPPDGDDTVDSGPGELHMELFPPAVSTRPTNVPNRRVAIVTGQEEEGLERDVDESEPDGPGSDRTSTESGGSGAGSPSKAPPRSLWSDDSGPDEQAPIGSATVCSRGKGRLPGATKEEKKALFRASASRVQNRAAGLPQFCPGFGDDSQASELMKAIAFRRQKTINLEQSWGGQGAKDESGAESVEDDSSDGEGGPTREN